MRILTRKGGVKLDRSRDKSKGARRGGGGDVLELHHAEMFSASPDKNR